MEDRFLVLRCKRGCRRSFARIYSKYRQGLVQLAMALLNDTAAAEDVVHDVFVGFSQGLQGFRLTGSLKGYLLTCVANRVRNHNRDQRPRIIESDGATEQRGCARPPLERIVCNEQLQRMAAALELLPYDQREVIGLRLYGQMTFRAIARDLGIAVTTAKSRYQYGLNKLRVSLNGELEP
jgi:RNA polymerase sigma-70 factor, ECF subfamily